MVSVFDDLYVGGTRVRLIEGKPLDHLGDGIYSSTNAQGVMAAGLASEIRRIAGSDVERELRAFQYLRVGHAYLTGPGQLSERGVRSIAHGVAVMRPGDSATLDSSMKALLAGLQLLEGESCRSVTVPLVGWRVATRDPVTAAASLGDVVISHLRRGSRFDQVTIVGSHQPYLEAIAAACRRHKDV